MLEYPNAPAPESTPDGAPAPSPSSGPGPAPLPPRAVPPKKGSSRATIALYAVAAMVAIGGLAFAAGRMTAPAEAANAANGFQRAGFARGSFAPGANFVPGEGRGQGFGGIGGGGVTLSGTVESVTATSMTVKTASGQTVTVDLGGSTTYHRQAAASSSDVTTGSNVKVQVEFGVGGTVVAPGAQGGAAQSPQPSGARTFTASDVTLVNP